MWANPYVCKSYEEKTGGRTFINYKRNLKVYTLFEETFAKTQICKPIKFQ